MEAERTLNILLVTLFREIMNIEQDALISGEFADITVNDMHVIEAIDMEGARNMHVIGCHIFIFSAADRPFLDQIDIAEQLHQHLI